MDIAAEGKREAEVLMASQQDAASVLLASQKEAARVLEASQVKQVAALPEEGARAEFRRTLDEATVHLENVEQHVADLLLKAQREAAAILLEARMKVLDGREPSE